MPRFIPCKPHAGGTPVAPQVYANVGSWRTPERQRSKELCIEICILSLQYAKEYSFGYIHAITPTRKLTPLWISSGLSNAPWVRWRYSQKGCIARISKYFTTACKNKKQIMVNYAISMMIVSCSHFVYLFLFKFLCVFSCIYSNFQSCYFLEFHV